MDLLIKGAEIPNNKGPLFYACLLALSADGSCEMVFNEKSYPIAEIPTPHGRLIDADATIARLKHLYCDGCGCDCSTCPWGAFIKYIDGRPTIIEPEE